MAKSLVLLSGIGVAALALAGVSGHHVLAATNTVSNSGVTLTASQPLLRTGQAVALYATSPNPLSGGQVLEIIDQSTNQVVGLTQSGSNLSAVWQTNSPQLQTFEAKVTQKSQPITISWVDQGDGDNRGYANAAGDTVSLAAPQTDTPGTPITVTASSVGFTAPVYQFWYAQQDGQWLSSGAFNAKSSFSFTPPDGLASVLVYAREASAPSSETALQRAQYEAKSETYSIAVSSSSAPGSSPTTSTAANPNAWVGMSLTNEVSTGTSMQWIAQASGIADPVYQFWFLSPENQWESSGAYSASNTFSVNASVVGDWQAVVYARPASAPSNETAAQRAATTVASPITTIAVHS